MTQASEYISTQNNEHDHNEHAESDFDKWLKRIAIGTALITGAVVLSPYILPLLGVGGDAAADIADSVFLATQCNDGLGSGIAGFINSGLNAIPLIGESLAKGGLAASLTSGAIGIGGVLLGSFMEKKDDGNNGVNWGKVIRYGALITSALIGMPAILSGISAGVFYLAKLALEPTVAQSVLTFMSGTFGSIGFSGSMTAIAGGTSTALSFGLSHLLTCGSAIIPTVAAWFMGGSSDKPESQSQNKLAFNQPQEDIIAAKISLPSPLKLGEECKGKLVLFNKYTGQPLTPSDLKTVHTEKIHLLINDPSLSDFQHIHPIPSEQAGIYDFSFTPHTNNSYNLWTQATSIEDGKHATILNSVDSQNGLNIPPKITYNSTAEQDGLKFNWETAEPLQKGKPGIIEINVSDNNGKPVTDLQELLGADAHLVGFAADGKSIIHAHPLEYKDGKLSFHLEPEQAGAFKFYLQVKKDDKILQIPFGQQIKQPLIDNAMSKTASHQHGI